MVAVERGQHIKRQRLQFQAHIEGDQASRRYHQEHAQRRQNHQHGQLEPRRRGLEEFIGQQDGKRRADQDQYLGEAGEAVGEKAP